MCGVQTDPLGSAGHRPGSRSRGQWARGGRGRLEARPSQHAKPSPRQRLQQKPITHPSFLGRVSGLSLDTLSAAINKANSGKPTSGEAAARAEGGAQHQAPPLLLPNNSECGSSQRRPPTPVLPGSQEKPQVPAPRLGPSVRTSGVQGGCSPWPPRGTGAEVPPSAG